MSSVGLLYVGAVLFINGLMLLGKVPQKSAAVINLLVGAMQVIFPTVILAQAGADNAVILATSGIYLFGFTYLYVGINQIFSLPGDGFGWFSLFVAICAVVYGSINLITLHDPVSAVMWYLWAVLWFLFFLLLALRMDALTIAAGWYTLTIAHITATIPAFLLLTGTFESNGTNALLMAAAGVVALIFSFAMGRRVVSIAPAKSQLSVQQA